MPGEVDIHVGGVSVDRDGGVSEHHPPRVGRSEGVQSGDQVSHVPLGNEEGASADRPVPRDDPRGVRD